MKNQVGIVSNIRFEFEKIKLESTKKKKGIN